MESFTGQTDLFCIKKELLPKFIEFVKRKLGIDILKLSHPIHPNYRYIKHILLNL
jgi:hypothetical protein